MFDQPICWLVNSKTKKVKKVLLNRLSQVKFRVNNAKSKSYWVFHRWSSSKSQVLKFDSSDLTCPTSVTGIHSYAIQLKLNISSHLFKLMTIMRCHLVSMCVRIRNAPIRKCEVVYITLKVQILNFKWVCSFIVGMGQYEILTEW